MIREAPASRAPWTTDMPTPPRPMTRTVAPSSTAAVLSTAPTPVWIAQPMTLASSSGTVGSMRTTPDSVVSTCSAKPPTPSPR